MKKHWKRFVILAIVIAVAVMFCLPGTVFGDTWTNPGFPGKTITFTTTVSPGTVVKGGTVIYTFTVETKNCGATNVVITDDVLGTFVLSSRIAKGESATVDVPFTPTKVGTHTYTAKASCLSWSKEREGIWHTVELSDTATINVVANGNGKEPEPEPKLVSVRTQPMTCYQVYVNDDGHFEFIFWYEYGNNNWVSIYDMEGNLVYIVDFPHGRPVVVVDLPDGMYTVQTFHEAGKVLQEFVIGK